MVECLEHDGYGWTPQFGDGSLHVGASCLACDKTANRGRDPARFQSTQVAGVDEGRALPATRAGGISSPRPHTKPHGVPVGRNLVHHHARELRKQYVNILRCIRQPFWPTLPEAPHTTRRPARSRDRRQSQTPVDSSLPPGPQSRWRTCPMRPSPGCANRSGTELLLGLPAVPFIEERACPPGQAPALAPDDPGDAWAGRILDRHARDLVGGGQAVGMDHA